MKRLTVWLGRGVALLGLVGAGLGGTPARAQEPVSFVSAGKTIRVDVYQPAAPGPHPSALILHGAGGLFFDGPEMRRVARQLAASGVRAYLVHYFDGSGVVFTPSTQVLGAHYEEWLAVIRDAVDFVRNAQDSPARPVAIYGYSMGAFLGIAASSDNPNVGALAEESGGVWANEMTRVGRMPPVLMIHGRSDRRVPFEQYAVPLEATLKKRHLRYQTLFIDHERHGFSPPAQAQARQAVATFFNREIPIENRRAARADQSAPGGPDDSGVPRTQHFEHPINPMSLFGLGEKFNTLHDLYVHLLKDLYSAEHQLTKALPKLAAAAKSPQLQHAFTAHLRETENQIARLDVIAEKLGVTLTGYTCHGMKGIISEGSDWIGEDATDSVKDAGLIMEAQHAEHYEMAGYGSARNYAEHLGYTEAATLLQDSLDEEIGADTKLNTLAALINPAAQRETATV